MTMNKALAYAEEHKDGFLSDLKELVRIPSVSFPGFDPGRVRDSAEAVAGLMRRQGLENVEILRLEGAGPAVYGDWLHAAGAPTLLLYAHHDVQPPGREEIWKSPPFEPTEREGRLYGRGSADDKAGVVVHTSAVTSWLKTLGSLPVNVKMIIEGEEEVGSTHLEEFLRAYREKLSSDVMVLTDTGNYDVGVPAVTTSVRGLVSTDVTVRTTQRSLHSGMWGGPVPDPVQALSKMIASVMDKNGRLAIPGIYSQVRKLSKAEEKSFASLRYTEKELRRQAGFLPKTKVLGDAKGILRRSWSEPAFSVNAIQASSRKDCANIINDSAWCHMGLRIVPHMDPADSLKRLKAHLLKNAPWGATVEFANESAHPAWATTPDHPAFAAASRALEKGYERKPVFIGCGGSIPFVGAFSNALGGVPALMIGVEDPYTGAHSENESLYIEDFHKAIKSAVCLYQELSTLAPGKVRPQEKISVAAQSS